ncbi:MAG: hypothetical protein R3B54_03690 [Bdellovibrionota bacterium]
MCLWQRNEHLADILGNFEKQTCRTRIRLHFWNNNPAEAPLVESIVRSRQWSFPVEIKHSSENVGGIGRFYFAKELASKYPYVIFLDDDQRFAYPTTLESMSFHHRNKRITAFTSFRFKKGGTYWDRDVDRKRPHYCGTGGMICDSSIFMDAALYEVPVQYQFIEDLWLCYYAQKIKAWTLRGGKFTVYFIYDDKNQFKKLKKKKSEFLEYLRSQGWRA